MTHLQRRYLGKNADILMTITTRDHFCEKSQHKPPILTIILPVAHVENCRGPWIARGLEKPRYIWRELESVFKIAGDRDPKEFLHMEWELCGMWTDLEGESYYFTVIS